MFNSNYVHYLIENALDNKNNNLINKENEKMQNIINLNNLCVEIGKKYFGYLFFSTKINDIYNFKNESISFLGETCLFSNYIIKSKYFGCYVTPNFLGNNEMNFNDYEIKYICSNYNIIILNNFSKKIIYIVENSRIYLLKKKYNYFCNIVANDKYLLFDNIKENIVQFSFIDLSNNLNEENHELKTLFNFKVDNFYPKIFLFNTQYKFINIYENNQLCIVDYKLNEKEKKDEHNDENNFKNIIRIEIKQLYKRQIIPKIIEHSKILKNEYHPSMLFSDKSYYSSDKGSKHYIYMDFSKDYYFVNFDIIFHEKYLDCSPKKYIVQLYDSKKREINKLIFISKEKVLNDVKNLNEVARYIKFNFTENFGGKNIVIKNMKFKIILDEMVEK